MWCPGAPPSGGAPLSLRPNSAHGDTLVVTLLVLFPETGSLGEVAQTGAVSVKSPFFVGLFTRVAVSVPPLFMVPMSHVTSCWWGVGAQLPCVEVAEPIPLFLVRVSVRVTPLAV